MFRDKGNRILSKCVILSIAVHTIVLSLWGSGVFSVERQKKEIPIILHYNSPERVLPRIQKVRNRKQLINNQKTKVRKNYHPSELNKFKLSGKKETMFSSIDHKEAFLRYQDIVRQYIEEVRRYPYSARKNRLEGVVYLRFFLLSNGRVKDILLLRSSGFPILDRSALETVKKASPFPPIPDNFSVRSMLFEVALVYELQ